MITSFRDQYRFLSNFWPCKISFEGYEYSSVEAAYVAAKTTDENIRERIREFKTPGMVKKYGKSINLRNDWEEVKVDIMLSLLRQKFTPGTSPAILLAQTGDEEIVEGNTWGDVFWGVCNGQGQNMLGKLLMQVREENKSG